MPAGSTPPPTAMHGTPAASARRATPERRLAERGLGVDPALAGDDEVGAGQAGVEVGRLHDEIDAGPQGEPREAVLDREQAEADAAGRAGTRRVPDAREPDAGSRRSAKRARRPSRRATRSGVAPFWGP